MSDTEEKIKPTGSEDLRRSKRRKFHLDVVAVLSRRSPDFRRNSNKPTPPKKSPFKSSPKNNVEVDAPILDSIFPSLSSTPENDNKRHAELEQNGTPAKRQKPDESLENFKTTALFKPEHKPVNKSSVCYKCLTHFKSNAGLGKHVKTCKKYVDPAKSLVHGRLLVSSSSLLSGKDTSKNSVIRKESDSESIDDSAELDDMMPILTPECSLKPQKSKPSLDHSDKGSNDKRKLKSRRTIANSSLQVPFDIKKALTLKLEIPPVPKIVVDSPIDQHPNYIYCSKCPYKCSDKNLLGFHEIMHNKSERSYQCNFCSYSSFSPDTLHYHLNLHAPILSPNTSVLLKKQINANKRNGVMHNDIFTPTTSNVVQRMEQVQTQQQRLVSIIKRSAGDENNTQGRIKIKLPLPTTKFYSCKRCSFRTDRNENLIFHQELHGSRLLYGCDHCDYASDARTVRDFHQRNHHFELSLTTHAKNLAVNILKKKAEELNRRCISLPAESTSFDNVNTLDNVEAVNNVDTLDNVEAVNNIDTIDLNDVQNVQNVGKEEDELNDQSSVPIESVPYSEGTSVDAQFQQSQPIVENIHTEVS